MHPICRMEMPEYDSEIAGAGYIRLVPNYVGLNKTVSRLSVDWTRLISEGLWDPEEQRALYCGQIWIYRRTGRQTRIIKRLPPSWSFPQRGKAPFFIP